MCAECSPWSVVIVSIPWPQILSPGFLSLSLSLNAGCWGLWCHLSTSSTWQSGHWSQLILMFLSVITRGLIQIKRVNHHHPRPRHWPLISQHPPPVWEHLSPWSLPACVDYWLGSCLCNVHPPHLSLESGLHIISAWENFITSSAVFITNHLWYWLGGSGLRADRCTEMLAKNINKTCADSNN